MKILALAVLLPMFVLVGCKTNSSPYSISGGDGTSLQEAVIIKAPDVGVALAAETVWMQERYGDWTGTTNYYERKNDRLYHHVDVTKGDQTNRVYFDYTGVGLKLGHQPVTE